MKNFIKNRKAFLLTNAEVSAPSPTIINANMIVNGVTNTDVIHSNDQVVFTATVSFSAGIEKVLLYYSPGFTGRFSTLTMHDDGQDGDKTAGDGIYSVTMPTFPTRKSYQDLYRGDWGRQCQKCDIFSNRSRASNDGVFHYRRDSRRKNIGHQ
ncbi:MAG: hypothetical protein IPP49_10755 [Saprospiraceae bacterium]|nr:hypothetical protein [Saprospiraceae bacterium]